MSTTIERVTFPDLTKEQCIALTTFRKTGKAVVTPVWFAERLGTIYVETHSTAGKLKRLRHTARVTLAPCTYSGKVTGAVMAGQARILTEPEECMTAVATLEQKYGFIRRLYYFVINTFHRLQRKGSVKRIYIAITPISSGT
jgi:PPOX class probable F420-dependent enzyme